MPPKAQTTQRAIEHGSDGSAAALAPLVSSGGPRFAEVAVPVHVSQTFTYRLTPEQSIHAKPGVRIMVPFVRKMRTAYIVELLEELPQNIELSETEIKDVERLVDDV